MKAKLSSEERYSRQLEASRAWKKRNKEATKAYAKIWNEANKELCQELNRKFKANNPEKIKQYQKSFKTKNPNYFKNKHLEYSYGIPLDEYDRMYSNQHGRCCICGKHSDETHRKRLFVDHCHKTGKIRGLLCQQCNTALGMASDDIDILCAMIGYLSEHKL